MLNYLHMYKLFFIKFKPKYHNSYQSLKNRLDTSAIQTVKLSRRLSQVGLNLFNKVILQIIITARLIVNVSKLIIIVLLKHMVDKCYE